MDAYRGPNLANRELIEQIYADFLADPSHVDASWREFFQQLDSERVAIPQAGPVQEQDLRVYNLINAYRTYGHLLAKVNPIETHSLAEPFELKLETYGFSSEDLQHSFYTYGLLEQPQAPLSQIVETLKSIYCNKIGFEYMGLQRPDIEQWIQKNIERNAFKNQLTIDQKRMILQQLNKSELFEVFLHTKYVGQKRFSLEGGETLIPILEAVIEMGVELGGEDFVIGMAHRGRLNVLSNILEKSYSDIFSEFEEGYIPDSFEGTGDVKYHKGFFSEGLSVKGHKVSVSLTPNPSHLESVNPVVEGQVRAKQDLENNADAFKKIIPILIHGDAAIAGQGIIYETLQLYRLKGYATGGSIHVVINNQIGFTTLPKDGRSTFYCTDIARTFAAPVFHVNAEDPERCVYVANLAVQMRQKFQCEVFIELNCYRKYGHNETDEPAFTQPFEYQMIRKKHPIREIYRDDLIQQGVVEKKMAEALEEEFKQALQEALKDAKMPQSHLESKKIKSTPPKNGSEGLFLPVDTAVSEKTLSSLAEKFCSIPEKFSIHPKLKHLLQERRAMAGLEKDVRPIDWGMSEMLAYASLLAEGISIRISGQDSCRGTFSHRHAMWVDQQEEEKTYFPLKHLKEGQGRFDLFNSPLSEFAVLGFDYGYSLANPKALVIWEAQFGDFCNGAQVIIDQYIASGEQKWGQKSDLVLFLPHGYEGQGPEHSSGRMERFLSLAAQDNLFVVNPTTPAQLFHLVRRQALSTYQKPLIVFTPKGLLRHPQCVSTLNDFSKGRFEEILDDPEGSSKSRCVVFCSGRIYYELLAEKQKRKVEDMAMVRIEQIYPFHAEKFTRIVEKYKQSADFIWVQEEPSNMGAWTFIQPVIQSFLPTNRSLQYIGRKRSASPAAGSYALHRQQHAEILNALFARAKTASEEEKIK